MNEELNHRRNVVALLVGILAVLTFMLLNGLLSGCCNATCIAWRTTATVKDAATLTDTTIAGVAREKRASCAKVSSVGTPRYTECITPTRDALHQWVTYARPAINSALVATVAALTIAERAKQTPKDWLGLLKPAACALSRCTRAWGHLLPPSAQNTVLGVAAMVGYATCDGTEVQ